MFNLLTSFIYCKFPCHVGGLLIFKSNVQNEFFFVSLQQSNGQNSDPSHQQRWHSIEIVKGTYAPEDCVNDIAEVKFDKPIPIKVGKTNTLMFFHLRL